MICEHCAAGGDMTLHPAPPLTATLHLAAERHARCPGPTWCPCQHQLPPVVLGERRAAPPLARIASGPPGGCG